ncbi:MAG: hypothetical protein SGBAC_006799 [Bacillariaceae sp.]
MTSQLVEETLRSNNDGVAHAASNQTNQAAGEFCKSLRIAQHILSSSLEYTDWQATSAGGTMNMHPRNGMENGCNHHTTQTTRSVKGSASSFFVYQKALLLESSTASAGMTNENLGRRLCTYSAATCYNLALLYHQEGLTTGKSKFIDKAENLYSACMRILHDGNLSWLNPTTLLITIAASNNLAEIEISRGMVQQASSHIHLLEWLVYECRVVDLQLLSPEELHGLLGNLLHGKGLNTAATA